jgi:hypothetical protein
MPRGLREDSTEAEVGRYVGSSEEPDPPLDLPPADGTYPFGSGRVASRRSARVGDSETKVWARAGGSPTTVAGTLTRSRPPGVGLPALPVPCAD